MAAGKNPTRPKTLSEERLESVLQLSSDWYWEQDKNLRFTLFSGKTFGETGFESASLIGRTRWEIPGARFEPTKRAAVQAKLDARQPFSDHEYERVGPDGIVRHISASGVPVFDAAGRFTGYRGTARDITERKRDERLLALEHAVNRNLAEVDTAAGAIKAAIRAICETQGWECGRYFRVDEKAGVLRFSDAWSVPGAGYEGFIEKSRDVTYAPGVGLTGLVWQSGQPLWSTDVSKDPRVSQTALARKAGTHGAFIFPVVAEGKTMGTLVFSSLKVREPEDRLLQAVLVIGSQIGQFLKRIETQDRLRES